MRYREFITELFNTEPLELEWDGYGEEQEAKAVLPSRPGYPSDVLRIKFTEVADGVAEVFFSLNDDFDLTGRGNVSVIFSTVINAISDYVRDMEDTIETIIFTAKEPSRARMYDTLSKRVAAKFGWHVVPYDEMQKRYIDYLDALDFNFVIAKGPAPEQYKDVNKPQHGEFKPILYVYHTEDLNLPSIKLHAKSDEEAYQWVVNNISKIQGYQDQEIDTKKLRATTIKPGLRKMLDLTNLTEAHPNQQISKYRYDGPTYRQKRMPSLEPDPVDNARRFMNRDSGSYELNTDQIDIKKLLQHLDNFSEREKLLIKLRYFDDLTLDEIATKFNISKERLRQIEAKIFRKLAYKVRPQEPEVSENFPNNNPQATNQESGPEWESELMDIWSPKASRYMARVVKQSFNSLYPDVKLKVWAEDEGVTATTDLASTDVKADVFGQWGKKDWECNFFCGPLFNHADGRKYLELMVDDAASGSYPGVWKIIVSEWKNFALSQLKKTGAEDVCFSVNEDMSGGAWEKIASAVGIKYIAHDLDEGYRRQVENLSEGQVTNTIMAFALAGGLILGSGAGYIKYTQKERWKEAYTQIKEQDPETARQIQAMVNRYMSTAHKNPIDAYIASKAIDKAITDFEKKNLNKQQTTPENFADGKNPQDKGDSKRHGVPTKASVSTLRKVAKQGGRKGQLAHWMANMKAGKAKKK